MRRNASCRQSGCSLAQETIASVGFIPAISKSYLQRRQLECAPENRSPEELVTGTSRTKSTDFPRVEASSSRFVLFRNVLSDVRENEKARKKRALHGGRCRD